MTDASPRPSARRSIDDVPVAGQRVLVRVDFNVPLNGDRITDDRRIRQALPTIRSIVDRGGRAILMSHLGRPGGQGPEDGLGLGPVAARLGDLLGDRAVRFVPGMPDAPEAAEAAGQLADGEVLVLDNLRFAAGEKKGDAAFAERLAAMADAYCNDAFGTAHRGDASMVAVARAMADRPRAVGHLMARELEYLAGAIDRGERPFVGVLGGAKISDKFKAIHALSERVDTILIGGAMSYTLMQARGETTGTSLIEADIIPAAREMLEAVAARGATILLPQDHVCAAEFKAGAETTTIEGGIPDGLMGLDIGPRTAATYADVIRGARTVIWNGPMGVFEMPPYDAGTNAVAQAMVEATGTGATTVIGGGDSAAAIEAAGLADRVSHVSTGGGASLAMLEGAAFPSLAEIEPA